MSDSKESKSVHRCETCRNKMKQFVGKGEKEGQDTLEKNSLTICGDCGEAYIVEEVEPELKVRKAFFTEIVTQIHPSALSSVINHVINARMMHLFKKEKGKEEEIPQQAESKLRKS